MEKCEKELKSLLLLIEGRAELEAIHATAMHECVQHNKSCDTVKEISRTIVAREPHLDKAITDFIKCLGRT